jgi:hypothetical protein
MKEECELYSATHQGKSNTISTTKRPGFEALLAGDAFGGSAFNFGSYGRWWSASSASSALAWSRIMSSGSSQVSSGYGFRDALDSVRCKKD